MNCHECKFVWSVPGSCHSSCHHPMLGEEKHRVIAMIAVAIHGEFPPFGIKINEHGLRKGWANWPMDFDPVWIYGCNKFEPKEQPKETNEQTTDTPK